MNLCEKCAADCRNKHAIEPGETVVHCGDYKPPMTNGDRLRAMSDEELAVWLCDLFSVDTCYTHCPGCDSCNDADGTSNGLKKWLQQPAEEG